MTSNGCCQVEATTWPLVGSLFDIYDVIEQETFLPRGWTCVSCVAHGEDPGLTFAYVTLDLSSERAICTQTVTINPLEEDCGDDTSKIVQELPEILLQVVAKRHSSKKSSTNFLVTHIKSIADLRRLLTDDSTYVDATTGGTDDAGDAEADDDVIETGSEAADAESNAARDEDEGETIEIEEEVDDDDDNDADDALREIESSDGGQKKTSVDRKVAKKSTTRTSTAAKATTGSVPANKRNLTETSEDTDSGSAGKKKKPDPKPKANNGFKFDASRPFQCMECDASFKYRNHFKDHLRVHTDDTFKCPLCDYVTKLQAPFTSHLTDRHGNGTYRCSDHGSKGCKQVFERPHDLARHLPKDHGIDIGFCLHHYDPKIERMKAKKIDEAVAAIEKALKGQKFKATRSSGRGRGRSKASNTPANKSTNKSVSKRGLRSSKPDSGEEEEEASEEDSGDEKPSRTSTGVVRRSGVGTRPGVVTLKRGAPGRKTKKYESDDDFVPTARSGRERSSRGKKSADGSDDSDDDGENDENDDQDDDEEEESPTKRMSRRKKGDQRDSDAENNELPVKSKPMSAKRAESSVDAPEYVTTPSSAATSKGRLADDFDYGDGSLEDMQRLMKLYQKDGSSSSTGSSSAVGSKGRVSQSVLSSTVDDFDDSPPKAYSAPKRGRPVRTESPSSPMSEVDDVPDPAAEWLKSFRLGCKECDVEAFSSDNLFVQHHLDVHQDDRPYKCQNLEKDHVTPRTNPDCSSSFRQRHHYKEHIRGVHNPEIKHFKCKLCPKRYSTRSGLTNHSANHSSFKCPTCDLGFNKETTLQKHMIDFNHFGNVADRSSFNEEELRKSLEDMAKSLGAGSSLPPFPTNIHAAGSVPSSSEIPTRPSPTSVSRASTSPRGSTSTGRPFARPFAQRNTDGPNKPFARSAPGAAMRGRPFQRPFASANRPTPFGRPFPKPFQRQVPTPSTDLDGEIEEVVLD